MCVVYNQQVLAVALWVCLVAVWDEKAREGGDSVPTQPPASHV